MLIFFKMRWGQLLRMMDELGLARALFFLLFLLLIAGQALKKAVATDNAELIAIVNTLLVLSVHLQRKDVYFMENIGLNRHRLLFLEYFALSLPALTACLFTDKLYTAPAIIAANAIMLLIPHRKNIAIQRKALKVPLVPAAAFEWRSGFRKNIIGISLIYIAAAAFSMYTVAVPAALLILALTAAGFYLEGEPRELLEAFNSSPQRFLWVKLRTALKLFWVMCLPLLVLFLLLHAPYWYILLYIIVACSCTLLFGILFKYALYSPGENLENNMLFIVLAAAGFLVPFLLPLPFFMCIRYYRKSLANLNHYL